MVEGIYKGLGMFIGQCLENITMSHGLVMSLFVAGLVGGVTHCAGMCSPFVLAQVEGSPQIRKIGSGLLLPYHLGRMTTYVVMAALVHSVVNLAFVFSDMRGLIAAPLLTLAAVMFLISAFPQISALFPWAGRVNFRVPYGVLSRLSSKLLHNPGVLKRYMLGVLLGFMPCGLVVSALLASAAAPSIAIAVFAMAAFAVGTMPVLVLVGIGGGAVKQKYPMASRRLSQFAMVMSSLWLFTLAGLMVF